ncbi:MULTISPECIES: hypothetical protein [Halobacteriales]|uniref:hypothetical protein n=1 Tax=Halobacteriales TaxID=2235 RepID=UPI00106E4211|nr:MULTISPECIES: hypothetical protein [Halobacteria]
MTETDSRKSKSTPRDKIYAVIHKTDKIQLTVEIVQDEVDEDLSAFTVSHALHGLWEEDVLAHKENSPYWYVK